MIRCDNIGTISKVKKMANGMLKIRGTIAKAGWLKYHNDDGSIRYEHVSKEVLFEPSHLESLAGATLTLGHPPERVTPKNYKQYTVGATGTKIIPIHKDGAIDIVTIISDESAIKAVLEDGVRQLSEGYDCQIAERSDGNFEQMKRECNHNAIVERARAEGAKLHLDGYEQGEEASIIIERTNRLIGVTTNGMWTE